MNNRCFKVILIPDPNGKVRELRVPLFWSTLVLFLLAVSAVALAWIVADYAMMKPKIPLIAQLEEKNERQKLELIQMSQNVISVVHELDELRAIHARLRDDEVDIETLLDDVRRAADLLAFCRDRLDSVGERLEQVLADFDED